MTRCRFQCNLPADPENKTFVAQVMKRRTLLAAPCIIFAGTLSGTFPFARPASAQNTVRGQFNMAAFEPPVPAPAFLLNDLDGEKRSIGPGQADKFILLNFWATWCPPCVRELPSLQKAAARLGPDRFSVFAVSVDKANDLAKIKRFQHKFALTFPIAQDVKSTIANIYGVREFPSTFLVNPKGLIVAAAKGERSWHSDAAIVYFEKVMKRHVQC